MFFATQLFRLSGNNAVGNHGWTRRVLAEAELDHLVDSHCVVSPFPVGKKPAGPIFICVFSCPLAVEVNVAA